MTFRSFLPTVAVMVAFCAAMAGCSSNFGSSIGVEGGGGGVGGNDAGAFPGFFDAGVSYGDGSTTSGSLTVNQSSPLTLNLTMGQTPPSITYKATYKGASVQPAWSVSDSALAMITSAGVFTPTGTVGGTVLVSASYAGATIYLEVDINISGSQNGPLAGQTLPAPGSGGYGGVGGEGVGGAVDTGILAALNGVPAGTAASQNLTLLYPYDGTVWPQGLLAPLLQWSSNLTLVSGIKITLATTNGDYSWSGTFGVPPPVNADGGVGQFIRHPILQNIWAAATNSAGGTNQLKMTLTVATGTGATAVAYGPVSQTWTIAPAALTGTIYYNSYGTGLVQNSGAEGNAAVTNQPFGAAVLSIASGATSPVVAAGYSSSNDNACRVCHVVAGGGGALIVQEGDSYNSTWAYTPGVTPADAGTLLRGVSSTSDGTFAWAGLTYDGTLAFSNAANMAANAAYSRLYDFPPPTTSNPVAKTGVTGIPANLKVGLPVFSADSTQVAFTLLNSSGTVQIPGLSCTHDCLASMAFNRSTLTFSSPKVLMDVSDHVGFASFMPTNDSVLFQRQLGGGGEYLGTWQQGMGQIYWADIATGTPTLLNNLNGLNTSNVAYIPSNSQNGHTNGNDVNLNFEPTVNPQSTGGYAWVIFTTRRIYGNVATQDAWLSDPRTSGYNYLSPTQITTKKLWVAAIDLNAPAGSDPSHPAFYLPGQEIQAGNSRGYWVLSPCQENGSSCTTGSECCNHTCSSNGTALVCSGQVTTSCSQVGNGCTTSADCCSGTVCINQFCSIIAPR